MLPASGQRAGENVSQALGAWLRDKGIRLVKSTPHEPWQNGLCCYQNVVFGYKYPLATVHTSQSSGGVIDAIPQSASAAEVVPGNVLAVDKVFNTHLVVRLQNSSIRTVSHRQFYAYLIDAQDSQFTHEYLNLLDAHILFEDLSGLKDFGT